jgi:hypothetical protein
MLTLPLNYVINRKVHSPSIAVVDVGQAKKSLLMFHTLKTWQSQELQNQEETADLR